MKQLIKNSVVALVIAAALIACGNASNNTTTEQNEGVKFAPQERTSSMTVEQREEAITQKRAEQSVNLETLLDSHKLRISVLHPMTGGDITDNVADRLSMKMLEIAAQNGISGLGTNPNIALGAEILQTRRVATGTAPQKMTTQYEILFKISKCSKLVFY